MIRRLLLRFLITGTSVGSAIYVIPGLAFEGGYLVLLEIVGIFVLSNLFIKPIVKIFTFPIEIATLGLFSIVVNSLVVWFVAFWVEEFKISSFWFSGLQGSSFVIIPIELPAWLTAVVASLLIGVMSTTLYWLTKG